MNQHPQQQQQQLIKENNLDNQNLPAQDHPGQKVNSPLFTTTTSTSLLEGEHQMICIGLDDLQIDDELLLQALQPWTPLKHCNPA